MKVAHLTTVDLSLRYLVLPQLEAAARVGEAVGISAPGEDVAELEARGIRHIALDSSTRGMNPFSDLRAARELWSILRRERFDVLHTHNPKPGVYGRILGRMAGVPIVVNTVHGLYATEDSPLLKRLVVYGLEAIASRFSDAELIQSPEDLELLRRLHLVPLWKLGFLGNGVDLDRFNSERAASKRDAARSDLGVLPGDVVVGMVGRLVAEKGLPELIEAAGRVSDEVQFVVVGPEDPHKKDALSDDLLEAGRSEGIRFLGMREDVDALYGAFDIFVLPSHREGYPRAAMEAAASGLPLILTDIRGCRQVVEDGRNGLLVPVGDPAALAKAIDALADDDGLRERMGAASVVKAHAEFDERRVVDVVMDTYRRIAATKGLSWELSELFEGLESVIRSAMPSDAPVVARLHSRLIDTGFLSTLGPRFLELVYSALVESESGHVAVAESKGVVVGFIAGARDTRAFYREFMTYRPFATVWRLIPALLRWSTWRRLIETLRYGGHDGDVSAELLSMSVAPNARGLGVGSRLVESLLDWALESGVRQMKVVVGADNETAISLYTRLGFGDPKAFELHEGVHSLVMTWRA